MHRIIFILLMGLLLFSWPSFTVNAMTGEQILRLKQAGVSDESIQMMIQEKSIETVSLTIQEVLEMKAAGIGEDTLQLMIKELSFLKDTKPVVYGNTREGLPITSAAELLMLKEAGFSEATIRALLIVAAGKEENRDFEKSLQILEHLNIWISPRHPR